MSSPSNCCPNNATPVTANVPGTAGLSAYTNVTTAFVAPALGDPITINVQSSAWAAVGETIYISNAGFFTVASVPSLTQLALVYQNIAQNTASGNTVPIGAVVTPSAVATDGTDGVNAYTVVTSPGFTVPNVGDTETIPVASNVWMAVGQKIFIAGAGVFQVATKTGTTSITATYLDYADNTNDGDAIAANAQISPAGTQPSLAGLGQDATQVSSTALTQDLTNAYLLVAGMTVTAPASGLYLVLARISVNYNGVTFTDETFSVRVRNTTQNLTISEDTRPTNSFTTTDFPAIDYVLAFKTATLALNDVLELQCFVDTVEGAGDAEVCAASLMILPLDI